jgi:hypothetical protein
MTILETNPKGKVHAPVVWQINSLVLKGSLKSAEMLFLEITTSES